jgi:hypothetical protein
MGTFTAYSGMFKNCSYFSFVASNPPLFTALHFNFCRSAGQTQQ